MILEDSNKFKTFPIVILCGGKSSRMQRDKSLIPFASFATLTQFQYSRLKKEFKNIYLSSKDHKFDFVDSTNIIFDEEDDIFSPLIALKSILSQIKEEKVFIISVDTPFIKIETINTLINYGKDFDIVIAKTQNKTHSLCGVFSKSCIDKIDIMIAEDNHKISNLIKQSNHKIVEFEEENEFLNLNTIEEYKEALKLLDDI